MIEALLKPPRQGLTTNFVVQRYDQPTLAELKNLWASMPGGPVSTAFQSPQVLHAIQTEREVESHRPFSVFRICRSETMHPVMLVPLMTIERGVFKVACMADLDVVDVNAPVLAKDQPILDGEHDRLLDALFSKLTDIDLVDAFNLPEKIGNRDNPFFRSDRMTRVNNTLVLDLDEAHGLEGQKKKSVFKEAKRKERRLAELGVEFSQVTDARECKDVLNSLLNSKWQRLRAAGVTRDPWNEQQRRYFQKMVTAQSDGYAQLTLLALRRNDEVVAAAVALVSAHEFHGSLISMGEATWDKYSPGSVLICKTIDWAQKRGIRKFHFGPGEQGYKKRFGAQTCPMGRVLVALNAKGRSYLALRAMKRTGNRLVDTMKSRD